MSDLRDPDDDNDGWNDDEDDLPLNRLEQLDTDGDGTGNNADLDDDNDGWSDEEEQEEGTNPLDGDDSPNLNVGLPLSILKTVIDQEQP